MTPPDEPAAHPSGPAPLGATPPWGLTPGWARAVRVLVPVVGVVAVVVVAAVVTGPDGDAGSGLTRLVTGPPAVAVGVLLVVVLARSARQRRGERELQEHLRPVQAVVLDRGWRKVRHVRGMIAGAGPITPEVRRHPYTAVVRYVVDGRTLTGEVHTAVEPVIGTTITVRHDERDPSRLRS